MDPKELELFKRIEPISQVEKRQTRKILTIPQVTAGRNLTMHVYNAQKSSTRQNKSTPWINVP
jgi:hypothetical protein